MEENQKTELNPNFFSKIPEAAWKKQPLLQVASGALKRLSDKLKVWSQLRLASVVGILNVLLMNRSAPLIPGMPKQFV